MTATASTAHGAADRTTLRAAARDPYVRGIAAITLLAAVIRFAVIGIPSFWPDEAFTINILDGSLSHALHTIPDTESTPPLYYLIAWGWAKVFGTSEEGVRSLSALCGVLTVPVVAAAATRLVDRRTGLVAALLMATNPFLIWFAQEARAYALLVLLAAIGFQFFVRFLDTGDRRALVWWAVASALLLSTHYYGVLMVGAEAVWLVAAARPGTRGRVVGAIAAVGAVGLALVPLILKQRHNEFATPPAENASTFVRAIQVPKQFVVGFDAPAETLLAVVCLVLVVAGLALVVVRRTPQERERLYPAAFVGVVVLVIPMLLGAAGYGFVSARYEVAAMVPLAICVAAGLAAPKARLGPVLTALLVGIWLGIVVAVAADPLLQTRGDWRNAAESLGPPPPGGRAIVVSPASGGPSMRLYLPGATPITTPYVSVSQIDVMTVRTSKDESLGKIAAAPGAPKPGLPPSFSECGRKKTRTYMIVRYCSNGPVAVAVNVFGGLRLDDLTWVALQQRG